jgi:polysaccharide biosynthesis transport protein
MTPDSNSSFLPAVVSHRDDTLLPLVLSAPPNPLALFRALRRRWRMALFAGLLLAALVTIACWLFLPPAKHTARTLLRIPPGNPFLFRTSEPVPEILDHQRNQIAMVKSRLVLNSALKDRKVADLSLLRDKADPIEWLERELQADFQIAPEVMRIVLVGDEPADMVVLVNVIREAYYREILEKERADRNDRLTLLNQSLQRYDSQLRTRKEEQRKFEKLAGGRDPGIRGLVQAFMQQQLNWAERELLQTQSDLRRCRSDYAVSQSAEKGLETVPVSEALLDDHLSKEPSVQASRASIQNLQVVLEDTIKVAQEGENSAKAGEIRKKIADAQQSMILLRKKIMPGVLEELKQRNHFEAVRTVQQLQSRIGILEEDEKILTKEVDQIRLAIKEKADNVGKADAEREDMANLEDTVKRISAEAAALEFELQAPIRYRVLEEAIVLKPTDNKRVFLISGGAGLSTLAIVLLMFALTEFKTRRLDGPDQVVFGLGLPLVGSIPDISNHDADQIGGEQSVLNEAVDTVRTILLRADEHEKMRVVLITSAQSGEGKTSLSTRLAASLAQVGYSTLLIDGDLRNPIAHRVFDLERGPGFCDVLRREVALDDVIRETNVGRLSMITAGRWSGDATRALAQDGTRQLIEGLRDRFDFIIIDSSPVLPVVDPLLLGKYSDGAILSVLREVSRMPNIFAAYQRLSAGGVRVIGAVMSGVKADQYGGYYEYGYGASPAAENQSVAEPSQPVA